MLWTLSASLLVLALVLIQFLKKVVHAVKAKYFVYPSDAIIDQVLPQEIMEHVMTFLDPRAMTESRLVSKYWNHHATKPNVEKAVREQAKQRLHEVFAELNRKGLQITDDMIARSMAQVHTDDNIFLRAAAIANKHGAELIVAHSEIDLCQYLIMHPKWQEAKAEKKYFFLTNTMMGQSPWEFSGSFHFNADPQFDTAAIDWHDTVAWSGAKVLIDASNLPNNNYAKVKTYLFRLNFPVQHFYFIPLNNKFLYVLMYLLAPLIVHDALHASYLPTIKSWFGPVMFLASLVIQVLIMRALTRYHDMRREVKPVVAAFFIVYVLLAWLVYPVSMGVFAGIGVQGLMFMFVMFSNQYFRDYSQPRLTKKKLQVLITGLVLMFLMVDWKLVVDATRDLTIFRTLFDNTVCYCLILLHFIFDNFVGYSIRDGLKLDNLTKWDESTIKILMKSSGIVIWMTLLAPTWRY